MQPAKYRAQNAGGNHDDHQSDKDMQQDAGRFSGRRCFDNSRRLRSREREKPESRGSNQKKDANRCNQTYRIEEDATRISHLGQREKVFRAWEKSAVFMVSMGH